MTVGSRWIIEVARELDDVARDGQSGRRALIGLRRRLVVESRVEVGSPEEAEWRPGQPRGLENDASHVAAAVVVSPTGAGEIGATEAMEAAERGHRGELVNGHRRGGAGDLHLLNPAILSGCRRRDPPDRFD